MQAPASTAVLRVRKRYRPITNAANPEINELALWYRHPDLLNYDHCFGWPQSVTFVRNPNYWASDERHPNNRSALHRTLSRFLIIPNTPTAEAAMRTGKIDLMDSISRRTLLIWRKQILLSIRLNVPCNGLSLNPRTIWRRIMTLESVKRCKWQLTCRRLLRSISAAVLTRLLKRWPRFHGGLGLPVQLMAGRLTGHNMPTTQPELRRPLAAAGFPNGFNTDVVVDSTARLYQDLMQVLQSEFAAVMSTCRFR